MIERRKYQRLKNHIPLKLADPCIDIITETADISPSGAYCRVTRNLPLMSKMEVVLLIPAKDNQNITKKIKCQGIVVRAEPVILKDTDKAHYNIAIFFMNISKKNQHIIETYLTTDNNCDCNNIGISSN